MTDAERLLWHHLRAKRFSDVRFRRQEVIGRFIVDFACRAQRLIVEADGEQHGDSAYDRQRDEWLRGRGFEVLRFWNDDVLYRTDEVLEQIWVALQPS
jgi:very-short-patch-repair endonuclease